MLLWGGQGISIVGSMLSGIAIPFLVLRQGGGTGAAGIVLALNSLPFLFLALPAGALIDRWDRKRVMMISDVGRGAATGSIAIALLIGHLTIAQLFIAALVKGICTVFFEIAEVASLLQVVAAVQLATATSYNQALASIAFLAGPPLGGALFAIHPLLPFGLDAVSFLISIVSLWCIRTPFQRARPIMSTHLGHEIIEGLRWIWHAPPVRTLALLSGAVNSILGGSVLVIIGLAARALPGTSPAALPAATGVLLTAAGIGGIGGAIISAQVVRRLRLRQVVLGFLWLQGSILTLLALAPGYGTLAVLFVLSYFLWPAYNAAILGMRLALIPEQLQGRVNAVYRLVLYAADPLGAVVVGFSLAHVGIEVTALGRGGLFLCVALGATMMPALRRPLVSEQKNRG